MQSAWLHALGVRCHNPCLQHDSSMVRHGKFASISTRTLVGDCQMVTTSDGRIQAHSGHWYHLTSSPNIVRCERRFLPEPTINPSFQTCTMPLRDTSPSDGCAGMRGTLDASCHFAFSYCSDEKHNASDVEPSSTQMGRISALLDSVLYRTLGPANGTADSCSTVNAEGYPRAHVTPFILEPLAVAIAW